MAKKAAEDGNTKLCVEYLNDHNSFVDELHNLVQSNPDRYESLFNYRNERSEDNRLIINYWENSYMKLYLATKKASEDVSKEIPYYISLSLYNLLLHLLERFKSPDYSSQPVPGTKESQIWGLLIQRLKEVLDTLESMTLESLKTKERPATILLAATHWYYDSRFGSFPNNSHGEIIGELDRAYRTNVHLIIDQGDKRLWEEYIGFLNTGVFRFYTNASHFMNLSEDIRKVFGADSNQHRLVREAQSIHNAGAYKNWVSKYQSVMGEIAGHSEQQLMKKVLDMANKVYNLSLLRLNVIHTAAYALKQDRNSYIDELINNLSPRTNVSLSMNEDILPRQSLLADYIWKLHEIQHYDSLGWGRFDKDVFITRFFICLALQESSFKSLFPVGDLNPNQANQLTYQLKKLKNQLEPKIFEIWWKDDIRVLESPDKLHEEISELIVELEQREGDAQKDAPVDKERENKFKELVHDKMVQGYCVLNIVDHLFRREPSYLEGVGEEHILEISKEEFFPKEDFLREEDRRSSFLSNLGVSASVLSQNFANRINSRFINSFWERAKRNLVSRSELNQILNDLDLKEKVIIYNRMSLGYDVRSYDDPEIEWNRENGRFYEGRDTKAETLYYSLGHTFTKSFLIVFDKAHLVDITYGGMSIEVTDVSEQSAEPLVRMDAKIMVNFDIDPDDILIYPLMD